MKTGHFRIESRLPRLAVAFGIAGLAAALGMMATGSGVAPRSDAKEQMHQDMLAIAQAIAQLKAQGGRQSAARAEALLEEYAALSDVLGGDDPGHMRAASAGAGAPPGGGIAGAPVLPAPPGCTANTAVFSNNTAVVIPTTAPPNVVSSTILVAGVDAYLWDLNLTTFITHSFCSDLDITLTSPLGTHVTITTDNGGGNDNVYNGTVWGDDADPDGLVPYASNEGLVTDAVYANLVVETPLVIEEALAALLGEDPNGTWTLTISDDANLDGGSLNSWSLEVTTLEEVPTGTLNSFTSMDTPVAIPATAPPIVVTSSIIVGGLDGFLCDIDVVTFITHSFSSDLDVTLTSPMGTHVTITTDNGGGNDNVYNGSYWDDFADPDGLVPYASNEGLVTDSVYANLVVETPLVPEEALGALIGENPNGLWTITISDDANLDGGSLASWTLHITTCECLAGPPDGDECEDCFPVIEGTYSGDTTDNTGAGDDSSCAFNDTIDEWYCYTASCNGIATASTCGTADFDTTIAVYASCAGPELACNDDGAGCPNFSSLVAWPVTAGTTYYVRLAGWNGDSGTYDLSIDCQAPCDVACAGSDGIEPELCGNDTNGGCNSTPPAFTAAACGDTWCGTAWASAGMRDTDWYLVDAEAGTLEAELTSEFDGVLLLVDGVGGCAPVVIGVGGSNLCVPGSASAPVGAGQYVVFVATAVFGGFPCGGGNNDYRLSIAHATKPSLTLNSIGNPGGFQVGDTLTVHVDVRGLCAEPAAGFQAFLAFDTAELAFLDGLYTDAPFGLPIIDPIVAVGSAIDLASGIDQQAPALQGPTTDDATLAILHFEILTVPEECVPTILFRPHFPPTRITNLGGQEIGPLNLDVFPPPRIEGDVNFDDFVDVADLIEVILAWGPCPAPPTFCAADLNCDGVVNVLDLIEVVLNWGNEPSPKCPGGGGDCFAAHGNPGCDDFVCCANVCSLDLFCCQVVWDAICAAEAADNCMPP